LPTNYGHEWRAKHKFHIHVGWITGLSLPTNYGHERRAKHKFHIHVVAHQIPTQNPFHAAGGGTNGGQNKRTFYPPYSASSYAFLGANPSCALIEFSLIPPILSIPENIVLNSSEGIVSTLKLPLESEK